MGGEVCEGSGELVHKFIEDLTLYSQAVRSSHT